MNNRFQEALDMSDKETQTIGDFMKVTIDLSKELVEKKSRGIELTEIESKYLKLSVAFHMQMLIGSIK
jgi:hypothetical protein